MKVGARNQTTFSIWPGSIEREPQATPICREFRGETYALQTDQIRMDEWGRQKANTHPEMAVRAFAVGTCNHHKTYPHGGSPRC